MLNTKKLLYILPDVAYVAELLPGKQEHVFTIHAFRQINGDFLDDRTFIAENVQKLMGKLESDEYHLILPDFIFTNTILEVKETTQTKIDAHLKDKLLPDLGMTPDSHYIDTFVLTQLKDTSKVQLSALDKDLIQPVVNAVQNTGVTVSHVSPLSWTTKAMISLEPSISIIQLGSMLYLAQHYIGVDQTTSQKLEDTENLVESIKTLKGGEPSIQTLYLLTNELVEKQLKDAVSETLPVQQLTQFSEGSSEMPHFVKQVIETAMRTLDISDFPVPQFSIADQKPAESTSAAAAPAGDIKKEDESEDSGEKESASEKDESSSVEETSKQEAKATDTAKQESETTTESTTETPELPEPTQPSATVSSDPEPAPNSTDTKENSDQPKTEEKETPPADTNPDSLLDLDEKDQPKNNTSKETKTTVTQDKNGEDLMPDTASTPKPITPPAAGTDSSNSDQAKSETVQAEASVVATTDAKTESPAPETSVTEKSDASSSAPATSSPVVASPKVVQATSTTTTTPAKTSDKPKKIIKNKNNTGKMVKMIFITIAVLFATVAVGVGIGLGILRLSNGGQDNLDTSPVVVESPEPTSETEPSPSPSPSPEPIDVSELSILVVNGTSIAGKAGEIKSDIEDEGFGTVDAANAQGDYTAGTNYVLMSEENMALIEALNEATGFTLEFDSEVTVEDPDGEYDAVVVFADDGEPSDEDEDESEAVDEAESSDSDAEDATESADSES